MKHAENARKQAYLSTKHIDFFSILWQNIISMCECACFLCMKFVSGVNPDAWGGNMAGKDLRKLSKTELLELLVAQGRENLALRERLEKAEAELAERRLQISDCGSIAEAALKLSGVFEAAQKAVDLYRENCARECAQMLENARQTAEARQTEGKEGS